MSTFQTKGVTVSYTVKLGDTKEKVKYLDATDSLIVSVILIISQIIWMLNQAISCIKRIVFTVPIGKQKL